MCNPQDKAEILSELTGKSTNEIIEERINENKTYGTIAIENGVLEEFQDENLKQMKNNLSEKVEAGTISKEEANTIINNRKNSMQNCDSSGSGLGLKNYNDSVYKKGVLEKGLKQKNCINN